MTNRTIGIDNLRAEEYYDYLFAQELRWGMSFQRIIYPHYSPFSGFFILLLLMLVAAALMACILFWLSGFNNNCWSYSLFSALFITYPLIAELWGHCMITIGFSLCSMALTILFILTRERTSFKNIVVACTLLFPVAIGYEAIVFSYITLVLIVLFIERIVYQTKHGGWIKEGLLYAVPLAIDVVFRFGIGIVLLSAKGLSFARTGQTQINWGQLTILEIIKEISYNAYYYIIRAFEYMPIGIWLSSLMVFIVVCIVYAIKNKNLYSFLFGGMIIVSLFLLSIIRGSYLSYRMAWGLPIFVAFVGWLLIAIVKENTKIFGIIHLKHIIVACLLFLCLQQGLYLHYILELDNQRSENEAAIARQIGYRLLSEYEEKKVIFVGELDLGDYIESQITADEKTLGGSIEHAFRERFTPGVPNYKFVESVIESHMNWSKKTGQVGQRYMGVYLSYLGYDIKVDEEMTWEKLEEYENLADKLEMKPLEICDMGEYILVNLG